MQWVDLGIVPSYVTQHSGPSLPHWPPLGLLNSQQVRDHEEFISGKEDYQMEIGHEKCSQPVAVKER